MSDTIVVRTVTHLDDLAGGKARRAWAAAVIALAERDDGSGDLAALGALGERLGEQLGQMALGMLGGKATAYGKSAIVGSSAALEVGPAILHPRLGKPLRALLGGGKALIPSTIKKGGPGTAIDVPLHGKDDEWDFALLDSIEARVADAPGPREVVVVVALAVGGRPGARIGVD